MLVENLADDHASLVGEVHSLLINDLYNLAPSSSFEPVVVDYDCAEGVHHEIAHFPILPVAVEDASEYLQVFHCDFILQIRGLQ